MTKDADHNETAELRLAMTRIEDMAEERHLLHGSVASNFWNCSRPCCQQAAAFLRGRQRPFCKARAGSGADVQDCDWPWCGCDPVADRVLAAIQEQGLEIVKGVR